VGKLIALSKHAQDILDERDIAPEGPNSPTKSRLLKSPILAIPARFELMRPIAAFGSRMLRVVYYDTGTELRVMTLFFVICDRRPPRWASQFWGVDGTPSRQKVSDNAFRHGRQQHGTQR
jgi:hypothetical protein